MTLDEATERMNRARALLADALLPRDHGVYWCARDVDQRKIDEAIELLITNAPLERLARSDDSVQDDVGEGFPC